MGVVILMWIVVIVFWKILLFVVVFVLEVFVVVSLLDRMIGWFNC